MMKSVASSLAGALVALAVLSSCDHKPSPPEKASKGGGDTSATQVAADPAAAVPSDVAADPTAVRAPVAADLAAYTKDIPGTGALTADITTSMGKIHCELFGDKRPVTVANFVGLATGKKPWTNPSGEVQQGKPFYNGLTFHRVIPNFMIQGGDPEGRGSGGPGYKFANEVDPPLTHGAGALAMANAGPNTNGSQFYITEIPQPALDGGAYVVFGQCREVDVVKAIARVKTGPNDRPMAPVTIESIVIGRASAATDAPNAPAAVGAAAKPAGKDTAKPAPVTP